MSVVTRKIVTSPFHDCFLGLLSYTLLEVPFHSRVSIHAYPTVIALFLRRHIHLPITYTHCCHILMPSPYDTSVSIYMAS